MFLFQAYYRPLGSQGSEFNLTSHPIITEIAGKLGQTPAQVILRWGIQMGHGVRAT